MAPSTRSSKSPAKATDAAVQPNPIAAPVQALPVDRSEETTSGGIVSDPIYAKVVQYRLFEGRPIEIEVHRLLNADEDDGLVRDIIDVKVAQNVLDIQDKSPHDTPLHRPIAVIAGRINNRAKAELDDTVVFGNAEDVETALVDASKFRSLPELAAAIDDPRRVHHDHFSNVMQEERKRRFENARRVWFVKVISGNHGLKAVKIVAERHMNNEERSGHPDKFWTMQSLVRVTILFDLPPNYRNLLANVVNFEHVRATAATMAQWVKILRSILTDWRASQAVANVDYEAWEVPAVWFARLDLYLKAAFDQQAKKIWDSDLMMQTLKWMATTPNNVFPSLKALLREVEEKIIVGLQDDDQKMGKMRLTGGSIGLYLYKLYKSAEPWSTLHAIMVKVVTEKDLEKAGVDLTTLKTPRKQMVAVDNSTDLVPPANPLPAAAAASSAPPKRPSSTVRPDPKKQRTHSPSPRNDKVGKSKGGKGKKGGKGRRGRKTVVMTFKAEPNYRDEVYTMRFPKGTQVAKLEARILHAHLRPDLITTAYHHLKFNPKLDGEFVDVWPEILKLLAKKPVTARALLDQLAADMEEYEENGNKLEGFDMGAAVKVPGIVNLENLESCPNDEWALLPLPTVKHTFKYVPHNSKPCLVERILAMDARFEAAPGKDIDGYYQMHRGDDRFGQFLPNIPVNQRTFQKLASSARAVVQLHFLADWFKFSKARNVIMGMPKNSHVLLNKDIRPDVEVKKHVSIEPAKMKPLSDKDIITPVYDVDDDATWLRDQLEAAAAKNDKGSDVPSKSGSPKKTAQAQKGQPKSDEKVATDAEDDTSDEEEAAKRRPDVEVQGKELDVFQLEMAGADVSPNHVEESVVAFLQLKSALEMADVRQVHDRGWGGQVVLAYIGNTNKMGFFWTLPKEAVTAQLSNMLVHVAGKATEFYYLGILLEQADKPGSHEFVWPNEPNDKVVTVTQYQVPTDAVYQRFVAQTSLPTRVDGNETLKRAIGQGGRNKQSVGNTKSHGMLTWPRMVMMSVFMRREIWDRSRKLLAMKPLGYYTALSADPVGLTRYYEAACQAQPPK